MVDQELDGRQILVVEDEYLIADDIREALSAAGADVLGPFPTVRAAAALLGSDAGIDAAVLDINLRGDPVFEIADALIARGTPFLFATGYDRCAIPDRFGEIVRLEKPLNVREIVATLHPLMAGRAE
jgi:DNA-binding response OmpR family regulator